MDIRNWSLGQIMQLPDCCFGRRWVIGLQTTVPAPAAVFDIAEFALPERIVIWEIWAMSWYVTGANIAITLALGDALPANDAQFNQLELVLPGLQSPTPRRGEFLCPIDGMYVRFSLRTLIASAGRRFVGRFERDVGSAMGGACNILVSSIPTEVPDCLLSV